MKRLLLLFVIILVGCSRTVFEYIDESGLSNIILNEEVLNGISENRIILDYLGQDGTINSRGTKYAKNFQSIIRIEPKKNIRIDYISINIFDEKNNIIKYKYIEYISINNDSHLFFPSEEDFVSKINKVDILEPHDIRYIYDDNIRFATAKFEFTLKYKVGSGNEKKVSLSKIIKRTSYSAFND